MQQFLIVNIVPDDLGAPLEDAGSLDQVDGDILLRGEHLVLFLGAVHLLFFLHGGFL